MIDHNPHVFISYSWSSDDYQKRVVNLATHLKRDGIEVTLDVWHLKKGQDKYAFMERCISDPSIDKVLILCDKKYAEKANDHKGGVGDETAIITPQVYGKTDQNKFIPVVMERDEENQPYLPIYLKSRMYEDLSSETEESYRSLVQTIYDVKEYEEPSLGNTPEWVLNKNTNSTSSEEAKTKELVNKLKLEVRELKKARTWGTFDDKPLFDRIAAVSNYPEATVLLVFAAKHGGRFVVTSDLSHSDPYISIGEVNLPDNNSSREASAWEKAVKILDDNGFIECLSSTDTDEVFKITEEGWNIADEEAYSFDSDDYSDPYKMLAEIKE